MENFNTFITSSSGTTNRGFMPIVWDSNITASTEVGTSMKVEKKSKMPVKIFFKLMKKKMGILQGMSYGSRIKKIQVAIEQADKSGQIAFSEELTKRFFVLLQEAELWALGKKIFLEKTDYEKFKDKTPRSIALTAFKNYARPIPKKVLEEKAKCDARKIFNAYAVMHYDEPGTVKETEKERMKREKDPILFGIIESSSRLYFVEEWEDELCDLTLDDIVDQLDLDDEDVTLPK